jgi:hypothetical protein
MNIEEHDTMTIYCRMLGHEIPFSYCRKGVSSLPCRKVFDCWHTQFDIVQFMQTHYTPDQLNSILSPPKPKMATLIELIQQARQAGPENN